MGTPDHLLALLASLFGIGMLVGLGFYARSHGWSRRLEVGLGLFATVQMVGRYIWYSVPWSEMDPVLPLHLCNLSELLACLSLLTRWYWFRPVLYFWGVIALIAFINPVPPTGPGFLPYGLFWFGHALILGVASYNLIILRFRPRLKDLLVTIGISLGYVALVFPLNLLLDSNYGFLGPTDPNVATLLDGLGPWPLRAAWMVLIGIGVMVFAWVPWGSRER
jgi:hypothetical integral membrane protein (TIGR02206 family)